VSQIALIKTLKRLELSFDGSYTNDSQHSDQKAWDLDIWMSALAAHDNLAELALDSIEQTYLGQKFSDALKNTRSIKQLQINFDNNTQDQARLICEGLIKNNSVRELDLQLDTIDLESMCNFLRKNSTLEKLSLYLPELYQVVESNADEEDIEAARAAVESILHSLICNTALREFEFFDFYKDSTYAVQGWPELSSLGHWLTQLMQRNDLHFRVLNDAGTWIYHSDWHQPINQFAVDDKGAAQPYIPREIAEQIAKAVVLMLRPAEASRILRALRVWDVPRIVEAGEDQ
jgi:phosphoribosylformylglycinamidine (FGAM) synthase PurS component